MVEKLPIVGVMGSGSRPHAALARPLGDLIGRRGWHLLTGAGGGVMAETARAFCEVPERRGRSIGIVRADGEPRLDPATGARAYRPAGVNPWVEIPIYTHLPLSSESPRSRNHLNVLSADALVALPGSSGTLSEVRLRLSYGRPVILYLGAEADGLTIGGVGARELAGGDGAVRVAGDPAEVERLVEECLEAPRMW